MHMVHNNETNFHYRLRQMHRYELKNEKSEKKHL